MKKFSEWLCENTGFTSQTLYQEMAIQSPSALEKIKKSFEFVKRNNINCVLVGGMAVAHYTSRAITPDVDFLCPDIESVKTAASKENLKFKPVIYPELNQIGGIQIVDFDADFLDAKKANSEVNLKILSNALPAKIGGFNVLVADPATLTIQKFATGRNKDLDDAFKLLPLVDKSILKSTLKSVKDNLGNQIDAKTIWSYAISLA